MFGVEGWRSRSGSNFACSCGAVGMLPEPYDCLEQHMISFHVPAIPPALGYSAVSVQCGLYLSMPLLCITRRSYAGELYCLSYCVA